MVAIQMNTEVKTLAVRMPLHLALKLQAKAPILLPGTLLGANDNELKQLRGSDWSHHFTLELIATSFGTEIASYSPNLATPS
jgi:hypothetical protein